MDAKHNREAGQHTLIYTESQNYTQYSYLSASWTNQNTPRESLYLFPIYLSVAMVHSYKYKYHKGV